MHTVHLGVCQWANASSILDLCDSEYFGTGSMEDKLSRLTFAFNRWCRVQSIEWLVPKFVFSFFFGGGPDHSVRNLHSFAPCPVVHSRHYQQHIPITVLGISKSDYPELKLKAWTNRVMTAFLATCMEDGCRKANPTPRFVLASGVMRKLSQWLLEVEMCPRYLSRQQAQYMYDLAIEYLGICLF